MAELWAANIKGSKAYFKCFFLRETLKKHHRTSINWFYVLCSYSMVSHDSIKPWDTGVPKINIPQQTGNSNNCTFSLWEACMVNARGPSTALADARYSLSFRAGSITRKREGKYTKGIWNIRLGLTRALKAKQSTFLHSTCE